MMTRIVTTTLVQPKPTITLDDQDVTAQAGKFLTYTLIYSNAAGATGATTGTFTITLGYADYVSYTAHTSTPTPNPPGPWLIPGTAGSVFTDTLGPGVSRTIRLRMLVDKPLPYTLEVFTSTATIDDRAADISDSESEDTPVAIPSSPSTKSFLGIHLSLPVIRLPIEFSSPTPGRSLPPTSSLPTCGIPIPVQLQPTVGRCSRPMACIPLLFWDPAWDWGSMRQV